MDKSDKRFLSYLTVAGMLLFGWMGIDTYRSGHVNDAQVKICDSKTYVYEVSKEEAQVLDSTMNEEHKDLVNRGLLTSSRYFDGGYKFYFNGDSLSEAQSEQIAEEILKKSGLEVRINHFFNPFSNKKL